MAEWWFLWAWRIIAVLGLGGVLIWMGRTIRAMKQTVDAQKETISAQSARIDGMETFLKTMEVVLKSTDERTMLARLEAHKKFVEHEKDITEKRLTAQFEEDKAKVLRGSQQALEEALEDYATTVNALFAFATNSLPYVPRERRTEFIGNLDLDRHRAHVLKSILAEIAQTAPDLTAPMITFGGLPYLSGRAQLSGLTPPPLAREHCKFGHLHPPTKIVAATENPTQPWGPRPYHCPDCSEVSKHGTVPDHWREYPDPVFARLAGHDSACRVCFPT